MSQRLTDTELAAEYQRGEFDYERAFHGMCYRSGNWDSGKFATYDRRATLERFATLPHFDEDDDLPALPTLGAELANYIEELESLLENDQGIEGAAVPAELREILDRTEAV